MYTMVICVDHVHVPLVIDGQAIWVLELAILTSVRTPFANEFPVLAEYQYPVVAPI